MAIYTLNEILDKPLPESTAVQGNVKEAQLISHVELYNPSAHVSRIEPDRWMRLHHGTHDVIDAWIAQIPNPYIVPLPQKLHTLQLDIDFDEGEGWVWNVWTELRGAKACAGFFSSMHVEGASELVGKSLVGYVNPAGIVYGVSSQIYPVPQAVQELVAH